MSVARARGAIALGALLLGVAGCGSGEPAEMPVEVAPPPVVAAEPEGPELVELYGPGGELLESDATVAGLRLPRGLETLIHEDRHHVFRSDVPLIRMQRYFGVRLVTGQVDATPGGGATYHDALPRDVRGGAVRLEVTVEPSSSSATRVEITELTPPPVTAPPEAETIERMHERLRQAE